DQELRASAHPERCPTGERRPWRDERRGREKRAQARLEGGDRSLGDPGCLLEGGFHPGAAAATPFLARLVRARTNSISSAAIVRSASGQCQLEMPALRRSRREVSVSSATISSARRSGVASDCVSTRAASVDSNARALASWWLSAA